MSGKGSKKETDSKIKFFEIDELGEIAPAFPKEPVAANKDELPAPNHETRPKELNEQTTTGKTKVQNPVTTSHPKFEFNEKSLGPMVPQEFNELPSPTQEPSNQAQEIEPFVELNAFENIENINEMFPPQSSWKNHEPSAPSNEMEQLKPEIDSMKSAPGTLSVTQVDTLKKYLSLKESEVRDLKDQHRQYEGFLKKLSSQLDSYAQKNRELLTENESLKTQDKIFRNQLKEIKEKNKIEIASLKSDFEERLRSSGNYDAQIDELNQKKEAFREKIKDDLRKIKLKERELENKYELLKRDMQALLDSKDRHILELKKKTDAFELEMESLEDRLRKSTVILGAIESKKKRLIETMKLAISLLENIDLEDSGSAQPDEERKAG